MTAPVEISSNLFQIQIPLPKSPLRYLNAYVIKSDERNLIIDTGWNREECYEALTGALRQLDVNLEKTDIFITHRHADHLGLVSRVAREKSRVFLDRTEAEFVKTWDGLNMPSAAKHGFPEHLVKPLLEQHPAAKLRHDKMLEVIPLGDGDSLNYGKYHFRCLETPGHTQGHMCLYEPETRFLLSGDHILSDITSNIQSWDDSENPLKLYLASLNKIHPLEVDLVLPGHRRIFRDHRQRILELIAHHEKRLAEVLCIVSEKPLSAYETASRMTWDIEAESWEEFPVVQKWFATGEALSHLRYLEEEGTVRRATSSGIVKFCAR
jgi:glyoxylase-like metal-dependent hydrolase (beta-lactamase superfamily II)